MATDAVCALIESMNDVDSAQYPNLEISIFTAVKALEETYKQTVSTEDICKAINLCRVFTELGESMYMKVVAHQAGTLSPHFALSLFECIVNCCDHPDYEVPDITFNLWYLLSEDLYHVDNEYVTAQFRPYIERLIQSMCRHCQMEPDFEGILEDGEEFSDFRSRVTELIKDVVFIVGSTNIFKHMFDVLKGVLHK